MRKRIRSIISLFFTVLLSVVPVCQVFAANNDTNVESLKLVQKVVDDTGYEATVSELTGIEEDEAWEKIDVKLEETGFYKKLSENEFKENEEYHINPVKITDNKMKNLQAYYFMKIYTNSEGELLGTLFVYDKETDSLLRVEANIIEADGNMNTFFYYSEYNVSLERDFNVWGQNFACGMAGVVACGAYCAMLGAAAAPAGVACSLICGTAFAAACA